MVTVHMTLETLVDLLYNFQLKSHEYYLGWLKVLRQQASTYSDALVKYFSFDSSNNSDNILSRLVLEAETGLNSTNTNHESSENSGLENIKKVYFSRSSGPLSTAAIDIPLTRQISTTWFKSIFPVALSLIALVVASYIPYKFSEVRLAA